MGFQSFGAPITFTSRGRQFVAVVNVGNRNLDGGAVYAFALPS